ncbi:uncharacterized protein LOC141708231 [Apium graveolens]|uniref:uncharacterized protein LOC141708231 n=1 Tax=Apium graveolens TaxID=4045 RepID=UPI003D7B64A0
MECAKVCSGVRKVKKKQVKDELDRLKQAEKKRRRLEKALATSAAIRSELEKKKLMKQEEQKRLDEEGAAIAEAVALQVLGEDLDDSSQAKLEKDDMLEPLDLGIKFDCFTGETKSSLPHQDLSRYSPDVIGRVYDGHNRYGHMWNNCSSKWRQQSFCPQYHGPLARNFHRPYYYEKGWETTDISAGVIAEHAIASLRIAEDEYVDTFKFNPMLRW